MGRGMDSYKVGQMEERKQREAEFHNKRERLRQTNREAYEAITQNKKFYCITRKGNDYIERYFREKCPGSEFLDYCCGIGGFSIMAAKAGARVTGIDISEESIKSCTRIANEHGVANLTSFHVMDAEHTGFPDNSFDIAFCGGVLHHLGIGKAFQELSRILRPDGEIFCGEPLGYNPLIKWYRRRTPRMRTEWEAEHVLTLEDIDLAKKYFGKVETKFLYLASIAAVPFRNSRIFDTILSGLELVDDVLLSIPILQKQAWQVFFVLSNPLKANTDEGRVRSRR